MKKRTRIILPILVILAMLISMMGMALPVAAGDLAPAGVGPAGHGIGMSVSATGPTGEAVALEGDTVNVTIIVYSLDNSGDGQNITSIVDIVHHNSGSNSSGNLLSSPVVLPTFGSSVTVWYTYVVETGDNDPLNDDAAANSTDTVTGLHYTGTGQGQVDVVHPCIHIEKTTNGGDGLDIPWGAPVTWTYNVTNCGDVPLSNITVTDSHVGVTPVYVSGDNGDNILQTSETWIYQATGNAIEGAYNNTGYVDGYYGTTLVQANDGSSYFGINPCIHIVKTTNGGDGLNIPMGDPVTWTYNVTNCGNVPLSNITVTDSHVGVTPAYVSGDDNHDSILQTSETWIYQASGTAGAGTYTNTGYVDGYYGTTLVQANDGSSYFGTNPCIHIVKTTNGGDGLNIPMGAPVTWTYNVTNCGNVPLSNITVTDSHAGVTPAYVSGDDNHDSILQTSETWIYQASGTAGAGTYTNTGYVDGYYGTTLVQANDGSSYFGTNPCIHIVKTTNGGDGLNIPMGDPVTWTYNVTNCGNVPLSNITVTDSHVGVTPAYVSGDDNHDSILQTSETWIYQASGTAGAGTYTNTGYVDGYYGTTLVQANDGSSYFGTNPCIHIVKTTNGGDGLNIPMGAPVTWTYNVTNCGNVPLSNITVTDSHAGVTPAYVSGDDNHDSILQTSETWIYQASGTAGAGTYTNTGYVDGYYGTTLVQANDGSSYFGTIYSIDLEKLVNGDDADSPTGPVVPVGSTVTFTFNVTNTGNTALTNVVVTDNVLGSIGTIPSLAVGASQTLTKTASALAGQHTNVGNVTTNEGATDSDPGNYFGSQEVCTGCLQICKFEDKNGNGVRDTGCNSESWLSGWTFNVTDFQGNWQLVTTGGSGGTCCGGCGSCGCAGNYCKTICGLAPGNYTVTEISQAGWICTTGNPRTVTVVCNQTTTVIFGNQKPSPGCIKIYKFNDKNGNGMKDWGESYLSGWTFTVRDSNGHSWSGTTGCSGYVTICNLAPGVYTVTETLKSGWRCTTGNPLTNVIVVSGKTTTVYFGNKQQCSGCC